ncbi:DUF397 domain-containing protein [Nonomuraea sp. PA05]|uniref:DUF397 domain-containing protein n=1 Tax=Nonomuraea sp. PA05 TaxID=2604466 RepID=UPI0011D3DF5D|nr:DUF397 domain-containing protein [Nonomuraea sp. PA05]TYB69689.1 DUF397 domain-containing protein [Nonomuraea sp. PA05]
MWRRSSFCNGATACVEVAEVEGLVALRDSKEPDGPVLLYSRLEWEAFLAGVRAGEFDLAVLCASAGDGSDGDARARASEAPTAREDASQVSV